MRIFTLGVAPIPIVAGDTNPTNARDVYITNTGTAVATIQFDGEPASTTSALGADVKLSPGVGYLLAAGLTLPLVGYRPGSRTGSNGVFACSASATTVVVQIVPVTKTLP